jgi:hypothetical protein
METFAFYDTNVLLHFEFFDQVDWHRILGVDEVTLVFAPVTLSEVDRHGWSGSRRERTRAKAIVKKVLALGLSTIPVRLRPGVWVVALDSEPADSVYAKHRLQTQSADDRLIASFVSFREVHPDDRVLILSADAGLHTKARSRRIEAVVPPDRLALPDEPDDVDRGLQKARRELAEAKRAMPDLNLTFGGRSTHARFDVQLVRTFDDTTLGQLQEAWRKRYPHIEPTPQSLLDPFGGEIRFPSFEGLPGYTSPEQAQKYNADVDQLRAIYEAYLKLWPSEINRRLRTLKFTLVLENIGTAPADDVDVELDGGAGSLAGKGR